MLVPLTGLGALPEAVAQPAATDQYVEEQPSGPGTEIDTAPAPPPAPAPVVEPPVESPESAPADPPSATSQPPGPLTPSIPVRRTILPVEPVAEDDGGDGTLWLGGYGVTPFVFCVAALVAACLLWRLGTAGAARLRAG
jgi:hypothetical protein